MQIYLVCVVLYFIGGCVYVLFCDANIQSWAVKSEEKNDGFNKENQLIDNQNNGIINLAFDPNNIIKI